MTNDPSVRYARLGALSLTGGVVVVLLLYAVFIWAALPNALSGMDPVHALITIVACGVCAVLIVLAHLAIIRQLLGYASRASRAAH